MYLLPNSIISTHTHTYVLNSHLCVHCWSVYVWCVNVYKYRLPTGVESV